eukprot:symbB.v1.2.004569.t1/scaffold253.1/size252469/2
MGATCCGPDVNCDLLSSSRPNLQSAASVTCKEDMGDPPKAPKATSRLINGQLDPEVYAKSFKDQLSHLSRNQVKLVMKVVIRLQAYARRRLAKKEVERLREQHVVQHYMDPSVNALKPTGLFLQTAPARAAEDLRSVAQELSRNNKAGWKR